MKGLLEFKSLHGELKDIDSKKKIVTGYLASFGNKDLTNDIIEKGAFTKTLIERKNNVFFLNNHNWSQPHGKFGILQEDTKGLYFESKPLINTSYSSDLIKLYEAGIIKEHSIGFLSVIVDMKNNIRHLKEIKLYEGSNVTMGMNPETPFLGMKTRTMEEINDECKNITKAMRNGTFTDDTFILLEIALKQLQTDAYNLGKKSLEDNEPLSTQGTYEPMDYIKVINNFKNSLKI